MFVFTAVTSSLLYDTFRIAVKKNYQWNLIIGENSLYMIEKKWNLEQMRKRIENLKKVINSSLVDFSYLQALEKTDNELDALYITFYRLKSLLLKYNRELYGTVNEVEYEPKFDWDKYLNEYLKGYHDYTSTTSYTYSSRARSIYDSYFVC